MKTYNNSVVLRNDGTDPSTSNDNLNAGVGVNVTVRVSSTPTAGQGALASIFNIAEDVIANPLQTDNQGNYNFKAPDGIYDIVIAEGTPDETILSSVEIVELITPDFISNLSLPYVFDTVADMTASVIAFPVGKQLTTHEYNTKIKTDWIISTTPSANAWSIQLASGKYASHSVIYSDIRHYGGNDNFDGVTGANNKAALDFLYNLAPITIKLPRSSDGTGVYLYDGLNPFTDATGVVIEVSDGVSLALAQPTKSPLAIKGLKVNREIKSRREDSRYAYYFGPNTYAKPSEQSRMASASIGSLFTPNKIDLTGTRNFSVSAWPNGVLNTASPASATDVDINWGAVPSNNFSMSSVPVAVGDHVTAHISSSVSRGAVLVETDDGWVIISSVSNSGSMQVTEKSGAGNSVQWSFVEPTLAQRAYSFNNAAIGIVIFGTKSFGLTLNGVLIRRIDTKDAIISAGWGAGFESGGASLTISRASYFKNKKTVGVKPLKIVGVGDSTSDDALAPSQYQYLTRFLGGAIGAQVLELKNIAVAGQTSAQQLAILQSTNIDNFDYCLIQIGVNDIQTGVSSLSYAANVEAMIDYCEAVNVTPIVGLPTGWYSQADAQVYSQDGQATNDQNLNVGSYRDVLLQVLADRGDTLLNPSSVEDQGAILASLLATDLDPMVADNIHPTALGQMCLGYSYAKAIVGHLTGADSKGGQVQSPVDFWAAGLGVTTTPYYKAESGRVLWSWFLSTNGVTMNNGDVVGTLPERIRPEKDIYTSAVSTTANSTVPTASPNATLRFGADGTITAYNVDPVAVFVSFSVDYISR